MNNLNMLARFASFIIAALMAYSLNNYIETGNDHYLIYAILCVVVTSYIWLLVPSKKTALAKTLLNKEKIDDAIDKVDSETGL